MPATRRSRRKAKQEEENEASMTPTSYEEERRLNILKNAEIMRNLGLLDAKQTVVNSVNVDLEWQSEVKAAQRAKRLKRKREMAQERSAAPRRSSRRLKGQASDGLQLAATFKTISQKGGKGNIIQTERILWNGKREKVSTEEMMKLREERDKKAREEAAAGKAFLEKIKREQIKIEGGLSFTLPSSSTELSSTSSKRKKGKKGNKNVLGSFRDLSLLEYSEQLAPCAVVASHKLVPERIYSLSFVHLTEDKPSTAPTKSLVVAGDKWGNVGFMSYDHRTETSKLELQYKAHQSVIAGLINAPSPRFAPSTMISSSYDGCLRSHDLHSQTTSSIFVSEGEYADTDSFYGVSFNGTKHTLLVASGNGSVLLLDTREKTKKQTNQLAMGSRYFLHEKKINTAHFSPANDNIFATASLDRTVALWDIRKLESKSSKKKSAPRPVVALPHALSVSSAFFSPDGSQLLTTCMDDTLNIYNTKRIASEDAKPILKQSLKVQDLGEPAMFSVRHNNHTGRWLTKFQARWDPFHSGGFLVGSLMQPRCVEVYKTQKKNRKNETSNYSSAKLAMRIRDDAFGSVLSVNVWNPHREYSFAGANSSGKVYLFTND
eukprot:g2210.t1